MTTEQFWNNGLYYYISQKQAHIEIEKIRQRDSDILAWRIGGYVAQALQSVPTMTYGMTDPKDIRKLVKDYPDKPYIVKYESDEKAKQKQLAERVKADKPTEEQLRLYNEMLAKAKNKPKGE